MFHRVFIIASGVFIIALLCAMVLTSCSMTTRKSHHNNQPASVTTMPPPNQSQSYKYKSGQEAQNIPQYEAAGGAWPNKSAEINNQLEASDKVVVHERRKEAADVVTSTQRNSDLANGIMPTTPPTASKPPITEDEKSYRQRAADKVIPANEAPMARDLGDGSNGEKLGNPRHEIVPGDEPQKRRPNVAFTNTTDPGGDASTFASDVDSASFTVARAHLLNNRQLPPPSSIRAEEFINRFPYDYQTPTRNDENPFAISTDMTVCPWHASHQVVRVGIAGKTMSAFQRPAANLVFLIDVSGSMNQDNRLPLLKTSLSLLVDQLNDDDQIGIVTYAGRAGVALPATSLRERRTIKNVIAELGAGGSTHGSAGIREAYRMARDMQRRGSETRVILATDGDFNVGTTGHDDLVQLVRQESERGIYLLALGFGMGGGGDDRLQHIATHGNGFHAFIDHLDEAKRLFQEQLPANLVTIAQDVKIQVFFNPSSVAAWRLIGYENRQLRREDFNNDRVDAGEIGAGHQVTALYEIIPANGTNQLSTNDPNPFIDHQPQERNERIAAAPFPGDTIMRVRMRYQKPGGSASTLIEHDVRGRHYEKEASAGMNRALGLATFAAILSQHQYGTMNYALATALIRASGRDAAAREILDLIEVARQLSR
jgi:Ca-activated chloride channel homolog